MSISGYLPALPSWPPNLNNLPAIPGINDGPAPQPQTYAAAEHSFKTGASYLWGDQNARHVNEGLCHLSGAVQQQLGAIQSQVDGMKTDIDLIKSRLNITA